MRYFLLVICLLNLCVYHLGIVVTGCPCRCRFPVPPESHFPGHHHSCPDHLPFLHPRHRPFFQYMEEDCPFRLYSVPRRSHRNRYRVLVNIRQYYQAWSPQLAFRSGPFVHHPLLFRLFRCRAGNLSIQHCCRLLMSMFQISATIRRRPSTYHVLVRILFPHHFDPSWTGLNLYQKQRAMSSLQGARAQYRVGRTPGSCN